MTNDEWKRAKQAIEQGDVRGIQSVVYGRNVNDIDENGWTLLEHAVQGQKKDIVDWLLNEGALVNPPKNGKDSVLMLAIHGGWLEGVQRLIEAGSDVNQFSALNRTPLSQAACMNQVEIVEELLKKGADPLKSNGSGWTSFIFAAMAGSDDCLEVLFQKTGYSILELSDGSSDMLSNIVLQGDVKLLSFCIKKGMDVNISDRQGMTLLMKCIMNNQRDKILMLLDEGADVLKASRWGQNALKMSFIYFNEDLSLIKRLLESGSMVQRQGIMNEVKQCINENQVSHPELKIFLDSWIEHQQFQDQFKWDGESNSNSKSSFKRL